MSRLSDNAIDAVAQRVLERIRSGTVSSPAQTVPTSAAPLKPAQSESISRGGTLPMGVFRSIDECVATAKTSFSIFRNIGLENRKQIIAAIRESMFANATSLARDAREETGLGRVEDKIIKNKLVTRKTPGPEILEPEAVTGDNGLMLMERAPYGVIGAITPTTNPTSTIICNSIGMLAAGNTVVFNVHPNAKRVSCRNVGLINEAVVRAGGPPNTVTALLEPTTEGGGCSLFQVVVELQVVRDSHDTVPLRCCISNTPYSALPLRGGEARSCVLSKLKQAFIHTKSKES